MKSEEADAAEVAPRAAAPRAQGLDPPARLGLARPIAAGAVIIALFFGGLGSWAALAPLESAAMAPGVVTVFGNRKTIQHLEGGIVDEIMVREGDVVVAGELLLRLDGRSRWPSSSASTGVTSP